MAGITEVLHAHFTDHAYPVHTHDTWDLMLLDDGAVDFALDRRRHGAWDASRVVLLPPGVPHDGRTVDATGFRKRVLYLDTDVLPEHLAGHAVDVPVLGDPLLRRRVHRLHSALRDDTEVFEAQSRLAFVRERLLFHLGATAPAGGRPADGPATGREADRLAVRLRELLDSRLTTGLTLDEATALLHAHPTHLIRCFTRAYGLPPHTYLTGRRIDLARRLLLAGQRPSEVAVAVGFYDQAHLNRHFTRHMGVPPARYGRGRRRG